MLLDFFPVLIKCSLSSLKYAVFSHISLISNATDSEVHINTSMSVIL